MIVSNPFANGLIEMAAARLDRLGYQAIALEHAEREAIAAAAVHCALAALGDAVIHPLGFARIPLSPWALDQPRVAVHIWSSNSLAAPALDIHDHCYDFVSICITGAIRHSFFEPSDASGGLQYEALHYMAGCCADGKSAPGEDPRLVQVGQQTVVALDSLSLHHGTLHRVQPLTNLAITVQFQSPCLKPVARVFRNPQAPNNVERLRAVQLSHERLAFLLESVVK